MARPLLSTILFVAGIVLHAQPTSACRFAVRDIGFADLGVGAQSVFLFIDKNAPDDFRGGLENTLNTILADTNMYAEIVNVDDSADHPAVEFTKRHDIKSFPAAVLFAPDERTRPIVTDSTYERFGEKLTAATGGLLNSPKQKEILEGSATTYGVVLLVEGKDTEENAAAAGSAKAAIKTMGANMDFLPKPIEKSPVLVTLSRKDFQTEQNLLWFLNLDADTIERTHAAVFYGRSRLLGPVLTGENLTEEVLTNILAIIGADCECGLDRRWMQGPMLTSKISGKMQSDLVESLGFDPDNPMIKMEMSMIVRQGPISAGAFGNVNPFESTPFGYQEMDVGFDPPADDPNFAGTDTVGIAEKSSDENIAHPAVSTVHGSGDAHLKLLVLIVFVLCIGVIGIGVVIGIGGRQRR